MYVSFSPYCLLKIGAFNCPIRKSFTLLTLKPDIGVAQNTNLKITPPRLICLPLG